jgi:hypothetical protein
VLFTGNALVLSLVALSLSFWFLTQTDTLDHRWLRIRRYRDIKVLSEERAFEYGCDEIVFYDKREQFVGDWAIF